MIQIKKQPGPRSLQEYAAKGYHYDEHTSFTNIKQEIREALCQEQGYICCYCMNRIEPTAEKMQIAHIQNQTEHREIDCEFSNMLGSCASPLCCNQTQKQHDLCHTPSDLSHPIENFIKYDSNGTITSDDSSFNTELNQVLNLNSQEMFFCQNRAEILSRVKKECEKAKNFEEKKAKAKRLLLFWKDRTDGKLRPFCGIAIWFLEKKMNLWENRR